MKGETLVFRCRDYCGDWMGLAYLPPKPEPMTREERAHPPGPGDVFVLHFDGWLNATDLLALGERICEEARKRGAEEEGACLFWDAGDK